MENKTSVPQAKPAAPGRGIDVLFKLAVIFLGAFVLVVTLLVVGRLAIYKIHPYERGLHLRGGMYLGTDQPGWHAQIPFWDTVIIVKVNERLGYVDQIAANTADDLSMVVSLQFTYRVTDPARFALDVDDPERILFEFVQGRLRDVVNTKTMADMMHSRAGFNDEILTQLRTKEAQYGVQFVTVQIQSATPPEEVVKAIKDRMVAQQRKEQADAEAAQTAHPGRRQVLRRTKGSRRAGLPDQANRRRAAGLDPHVAGRACRSIPTSPPSTWIT